MGKTIKINEQQLAVLVEYIKNNEKPLVIKEEELLEEGWKEVAMAGLILAMRCANLAVLIFIVLRINLA